MQLPYSTALGAARTSGTLIVHPDRRPGVRRRWCMVAVGAASRGCRMQADLGVADSAPPADLL